MELVLSVCYVLIPPNGSVNNRPRSVEVTIQSNVVLLLSEQRDALISIDQEVNINNTATIDMNRTMLIGRNNKC